MFIGNLIITGLVGIALGVYVHFRRKSRAIVTKGYYTKGIVIDYQLKPFALGGDWTTSYPYIEYLDEEQQKKKGFLSYPARHEPPFEIGEQIELILHNGIMYHKNSLVR